MTPTPSLQIQTQLTDFERYNRWIHATLAPWIGRRILDAGCSRGNLTLRLHQAELVVALDRDEEALAQLTSSWRGTGRLYPLVHDLELPLPDHLRSLALDTVLCLNLLEHLDHDEAAIVGFRRVLVPGGRLLALVPALPWLYGSMDRFDGHHRRYTRTGLGQLLQRAGFQLEVLRYFNLPGILPWFVAGRILGRNTLATKVMAQLDPLFALIERLERRWPPPLGQSLLAIARNPEA
ncbi:MAG: hypothetical protein A2284_09080 [Deltaproteobacteria bacterium RIFOXYA12_FULL_61_11]|nr:MAG: hypothetical protein A2284_09080 [Deltaproteobacteria bacterium RIFOXYA12_FULL_61_11]